MLAFRSRWLMAVALFLLLTTMAKASMTPPIGDMEPIRGDVLSALAGARKLAAGKGESNQQLVLSVVLKHDDQAGVDRYLRELSGPHSKSFHKYLTQEQIADRFGPSKSAYQETLLFLKNKGFKIGAESKNRLTITVRG